MIRDIKLSDLVKLEKHKIGILPDFNSSLCFVQIAVEDEQGLVGIFWAKLTSEIGLIFDKDTSLRRRMKAILEAFGPLEEECTSKGIQDTHVFLVNDNGSEERVLKKLGFVGVEGTPMYYRAGSNVWRHNTKDKPGQQQARSHKDHLQQLKQDSSEGQEEPLVRLV